MLYSLMLFIHILAFSGAFFLSGLLVAATRRLHGATDRREALGVLRGLASASKGFPFVGLLLFATGAIMAHARWSFGEGWIVVGIVVLVVMMANGAIVIGGRQRRMMQVLAERSDTGLDGSERAALHDGVHDVAENVNMGLAVGMVLVMVLKSALLPGAGIAIAFALAAGVLTMLAGRSQSGAASASVAAEA